MPEYAIETENLTKVFTTRWPRRALTAVDNISLRVPCGTTYGLLGPNGAGKTTFVKMLLSVAHPTTGRAVVFGRDSREPAARAPSATSRRTIASRRISQVGACSISTAHTFRHECL